ncbi:MAG: hypothetical protein ABI977_25910 [Acidobacteriota bacterium]
MYAPLAPYYQPRNSGEGALPLVMISVLGITTAANGVGLAFDVSFVFCLPVLAVFYAFKLYLLLHHSQRDKFFTYLLLTGMLLLMMPFGIYGFGHTATAGKSSTVVNKPNTGERDPLGPQPLITEPNKQDEHKILFEFFDATLRKETFPIVCWSIALLIEGITLIIGLRNRRDDYYYWE